MQNWRQVLFGILIGLLTAGAILLISRPSYGNPITLSQPPSPTATNLPQPTITQGPIHVQIGGQISNPGIYIMPHHNRLGDLIKTAGGLTDQADLVRINFILPMQDGDYFYIPKLDEMIPETARNAPGNFSFGMEAGFNFPIDLNTASQEALEALPGVGPKKAADIITYRDSIGLFSTVDDLLDVPGIGPTILESIRDFLTIEP